MNRIGIDKLGSSASPLGLGGFLETEEEETSPPEADVISGSVTDSAMGGKFVEEHFGIRTVNARRDGRRLFPLVRDGIGI